MANREQTLHEWIKRYIKITTGGKYGEIASFYNHGRGIRSLGSIRKQFRDVEIGESKYITNNLSAILVYVYKIPLAIIKPVVEPRFFKKLRPTGTIDAIMFPNDLANKTIRDKYEEIWMKYTSMAEERIWVSEYLPGRGKLMRPKKSAINAWFKIHKNIYEVIESKVEGFDDFSYKRIFHVPVDAKTEHEAIHYGLAFCKNITLEHMHKLCSGHPTNAQLYTAPVERFMTYALIDNSYLIQEFYRKDRLKDHYTLIPDMLIVEKIGWCENLAAVAESYEELITTLIDTGLPEVDFNDALALKQKSLTFFEQRIQAIQKQNNQPAFDQFSMYKNGLSKNFAYLD